MVDTFQQSFYILAGALAILVVYELLLSIRRKFIRRRVYKRALDRATETGKRLIVIGSPNGGFFNTLTGADYGFGDVVIDICGCPEAEKAGVRVMAEKVETALPKLDLEKYVIFQSCVFEYIDDIDSVLQQLQFLDKNDVFVVNVEWYSLVAYIYLGFLLGDSSHPQRIMYFQGQTLTYRKNPFRLRK
jgi:hypothetical protein